MKRKQDVVKTDAVVNPVKGRRSPVLAPLAVMVGTLSDRSELCRRLQLDERCSQRLFASRLFLADGDRPAVSLVGPIVGAPYAVMVLETLVAWGASQVVFFGWCGAVSPSVKIGDIVLPTAAVIDEGTSRHYGAKASAARCPSPALRRRLAQLSAHRQRTCHQGRIWTTDAIFRETRAAVRRHQAEGALAVEMEMSALFSAARFRRVDLAGILVVSDELSTLQWQPGFKTEDFRQARLSVSEVISEYVQTSGSGRQ
jgi:uridine phosphorylase